VIDIKLNHGTRVTSVNKLQ